jgi:hypothetical protein
MRLSQLLLGLVPLLGLAELALHEYCARRAPSFQDYAALAPKLLALKRPGIPVVVAPAWAEPLVRQAAPAAFPIAELTRPDDSAFGGFLEVSLLGANAPELSGFAVNHDERIGPFQVSSRVNPKPDPVHFDFVTAVEAGEVEVFAENAGQRLPCEHERIARSATGGLHGHVAYPRQRFECEGGQLVAVTLIEDQAYRPHRCILAQAPLSGSLVLRFTSVPVTSRLLGFAGFSYFLERDSETEQVELSIAEGPRQLGQYRAAGARGWSRFELSRSRGPGVVDVSLQRLGRSSSDFCFALEAR